MYLDRKALPGHGPHVSLTTVSAFLAIQTATGLGAATAAGRSVPRRLLAALLVAAGFVIPWLAPPNAMLRAGLAMVALVAFLRVMEHSTSPSRPASLRIRHFFLLEGLGPASGPTAARIPFIRSAIIHALIFAAALSILLTAALDPGYGRELMRLGCGVVMIYCSLQLLSDLSCLAHIHTGQRPNRNQRSPLRSRSATEFWGKRWNRYISNWLNRFTFRPLARRGHPLLGVFAAFVVSGAMHAWLTVVFLGWRAALLMGLYFVVQGVVVLAETRLDLRRWPLLAARAWTYAAILAPVWLLVDSFLAIGAGSTSLVPR